MLHSDSQRMWHGAYHDESATIPDRDINAVKQYNYEEHDPRYRDRSPNPSSSGRSKYP